MSFTYEGHDLPLALSVDLDMSRINLVDSRGEIAEFLDIRDRVEAEALRAKLNAGFERAVREIVTNPRAGHPAEFLGYPGTTTEEICLALDYIWTCGGEGYPREILTPLYEAGLITIDAASTARLTELTAYAWQAWNVRCLKAGHPAQY